MTGLLIDATGWANAAGLLLGYGLVSPGRLNDRSIGVRPLNLFGAVGPLTTRRLARRLALSRLNAMWLTVGAHALTRLASPGTAVP